MLKKDSKKHFIGTTILGIRKKGSAAMGGDGQVTFNETIMKSSAVKIRKIYDDRILIGFAGGVADALTLFERFELKIKDYKGNISRAAVELAKDWRTDKYLRRLEAILAIMDKEHSFLLSGSGEVIEPDEGILAIGSGGPYALSAAKAFMQANKKMPAREIVEKSLEIAASICIYTNAHFTIEEIK